MPTTATTQLQFFWRDCSIDKRFQIGVSLHSHTMYSEENLDMIPFWIAKRLGFDLRHGFWTPPLTPRQAYRLEQKQIEAQFQLPAVVSLTDHDDIRAGTLLRVLDRFREAVISTEWSIASGATFFHLGVHNLPAAHADAMMKKLAGFSARPDAEGLESLLEMLSSDPQVLVVLNHPLWDEKGIGAARHLQQLRELLQRHGGRIHALEVNGLRSWSENERVLRLGREGGWPVVAGGDRHGVEANAVLNLSHARTFAEFVEEVRVRHFSRIVFMPPYRQSHKLRILHTVIDVLRDYPDNLEGRRTWPDRVFYRDPQTGAPVPLAAIRVAPATRVVRHLIRHVSAAMRLVDSGSVSG